MRDPWFPIALLLVVLLGIWLGIIGPMPNGFADWLQHWQTLAGAFVALLAAYIAVQNTTRSLRHAKELEEHRRVRKHAAVRAVLPLALSQVNDYAEQSTHALNELLTKHSDDTIAPGSIPRDLARPLSPETMETLAEFIEYSDLVEVGIIESMIARIQIHDSRLRSLVNDNHDPSGEHFIHQLQIEESILDAAAVYAAASAVYEYARREREQLPATLTWDNVRGALRNMRLYDDLHPSLYENIARHQQLSEGPFERTNRGLALLDRPASS